MIQTYALVAAIIIVVAGFIVLIALHKRQQAAALRILAEAKLRADEVVARADSDAKREARNAQAQARERLLAARAEFERETREYRVELLGLDNRLTGERDSLEGSLQELVEARSSFDAAQSDFSQRLTKLEERELSLAALMQEQNQRLERIAGLTASEAKEELVRNLEHGARLDAANLVRKIQEEAQEKAADQSQRVLAMAIQRNASEYVAEATVSVVDLPSEDMKGRVIGREGRNIRAFEQATGVDLIVDDTPEAVLLSCFEPVRREIARQALLKLLSDGRIHPARIEQLVVKAQKEMDNKLVKDGEAAALEMGIPDLHPEIIKNLGKLQYRYSYGQNVLKHSMEVAWVASHLAAEIGANAELAKRSGLVHDIGKAIDREMDGTHVELGREMLKRFGETEAVIHAMECHHGDYEPRTVEAILITAADAVSAARPGARREVLQNYVKRLEKLEAVAADLDGVEKAFAIQAGRELRIVVRAEEITDEAAEWLARDVAKTIEEQLTYPGMIKVTVLRETRSVEFAR